MAPKKVPPQITVDIRYPDGSELPDSVTVECGEDVEVVDTPGAWRNQKPSASEVIQFFQSIFPVPRRVAGSHTLTLTIASPEMMNLIISRKRARR